MLTAGIRKIRIQGDKVKKLCHICKSGVQDVIFPLKTQRKSPLRIRNNAMTK
jgi:hypothetical protein